MSEHKDGASPGKPDASPANRLGLDYHDTPRRKCPGLLVDAHTHVRHVDDGPLFFEVADAYGVWHVVTMTPLDAAPALRERYDERISFIAIPNWRSMSGTDDFRAQWVADLAAFRQLGALLCKFWMAPPMRGEHGLTLDHEFFQPVIERALELGFGFMTHIGDPSLWFQPGGRYANAAKYGTKREQFDQLEWFLDRVAPRPVVGAHMGGSSEELPFLQALLDRYENYYLDSSATKWIVRELSRQPDTARDFMIRNADRVLFGSDLVSGGQHDFDHYASRYWTHQMLWETPYRGESPIEDPDADPPPLNGLDLPVDVLEKLYFRNAERLGLVGEGRLDAVAR